jgi:small subunit ribosomal protein S5
MAALRSLEEPEAVAARRGLRVEDIAPAALLRAQAEGIEAAKTLTAGGQ